MTNVERQQDTRECARAWVHGAIAAQCHWSANLGWVHSRWCDQLTETRMVAMDRDEAVKELQTLLKALDLYFDDPEDDANHRVVDRAMEEAAVTLVRLEGRAR